MLELHRVFREKQKILPLNYSMLLCRVNDHTPFSLFPNQYDFYSQVKKMLQDEKFENFIDVDERQADHPMRKKVAHVLSIFELCRYDD